MAGPGPRARRFTRVEYDRLIDAGFFRPDDPVELLGGQLIVAEPQGSRHYAAPRATHETLRAALGPGWEIRGQGKIAESSLAVDRSHKGSLYARARLADYWIVNLTEQVLAVYRDPAPDPSAPFGRRHRSIAILAEWAATTPLALPDRSIAVRDLLG
jgi:hypothetical protein